MLGNSGHGEAVFRSWCNNGSTQQRCQCDGTFVSGFTLIGCLITFRSTQCTGRWRVADRRFIVLTSIHAKNRDGHFAQLCEILPWHADELYKRSSHTSPWMIVFFPPASLAASCYQIYRWWCVKAPNMLLTSFLTHTNAVSPRHPLTPCLSSQDRPSVFACTLDENMTAQ